MMKKTKAILESDCHITVSETAEKLNIYHTTIEIPLKYHGLVRNLDLWIPLKLKDSFKNHYMRYASEMQ